MSQNRLGDYLEHIQQAASDACVFVEGLSKDDFIEDKRTQQAVIMSLIIVGEASTKLWTGFLSLLRSIIRCLGAACVDAQSHCTWILRYQPRCGLGYGSNGIT